MSRRLIRFIECEWGPTYLVKDKTGGFNGESCPLWVNVQATCFLIQAAISGILFAGLVVGFITVINQMVETCKQSLKPLIEAEMAVLVISTVIDIKLNSVKYASDRRWFQYIILIIVQLGILTVVSGIATFLGIQELTKQKGYECQFATITQNQIELSSLIIAVVILILVFTKLVSLLILVKKFYGDPEKYLVVAQLPKKSDIED